MYYGYNEQEIEDIEMDSMRRDSREAMKQKQKHKAVIVKEEGTVTPSLYGPGVTYCTDDLPLWLRSLRTLVEDEECIKVTIEQRNATYTIIPVKGEQSTASKQERPYTCHDCGISLTFPQTIFVGNITYCSACTPSYDKSEQW